MSAQIESTQLKRSLTSVLRLFLTGLRILIGWHFLYEGLSKLFATSWSAASYLMESHWFLSGFFHWIVAHPTVLKVVDLLNIWGLILIGLGLFFGCLTRLASGVGAFLIFLYYLANPPFIGFMAESTTEGHYLLVNKNLIEMAILLLFIFLPSHLFYGIDRWFSRLRSQRRPESGEAPVEASQTVTATSHPRRELLKDLIGLPIFGGFIYTAFKKWQWESFEERHLISQPSRVKALTGASPQGVELARLKDLQGQHLPVGKIKDYQISRLICGGNLISGYAHSRDLIYVSSLIQTYFADEKVLQTLRLCETCGINTVIMRVDKNTLRIVEKYRQRDGKIQWIAQVKIAEDDFKADIDAAVDYGAIGAYVHGGVCDNFVQKGKVALLAQAVDYIKQNKVLAGIAGHALEVIIASEQAKVNPDFYMKTLNSGNYWTAGPRLIDNPDWQPQPLQVVEPEFMGDKHDNIWSITPQQTIEFMKTVNKPWIAYKVLGAGAIHPKEGLRYAFENGADFTCVGMFDFQVIEDVKITIDLLSSDPIRNRPWQA